MLCPLLMYHFIGESNIPAKSPYWVKVEDFEKQMVFLKEKGFHTICLDEFTAHLYHGLAIPERSVIITFDDGHPSFYEHAVPILKKCNLTATMFVITDRIGQSNGMTWQQLRSLSDQGISLESHSVTHRILTKLALNEVRFELINSKRTLEEKLGKNINYFCYRGGHHSEDIMEEVKRAGYQAAVCSVYGYNDANLAHKFELRRIQVKASDSLTIFNAKLLGYNWQSRKSRLYARYIKPVADLTFLRQ